jgi:CTP synthase (UTP-ammonia lyase)
MQPIFIGLVGDHDPEVTAHRAIPKALGRAALSLGRAVDPVWIGTEEAAAEPDGSLAAMHAVWCVPGGPYRSMDGALTAIRRAREHGIPFLGTCGGFQHAIVEFARNVAGLDDADHAETNAAAETQVIAPLACSLRAGRVRVEGGSLLAEVYGAREVAEEYQCSYGLNPRYRRMLEEHGMRFTAFDPDGGVRGFELPEHPFFVGTLFQPERAALRNVSAPLVTAFVRAAAGPGMAALEEPAAIASAFGTF